MSSKSNGVHCGDKDGFMKCRVNCGACCIIPSISSPIPGMPGGKPTGVRCIHLTDDHRCNIFKDPGRPEVCARFKAEVAVCGNNREEAIRNLALLAEKDAKWAEQFIQGG